MPVRAYIVPMAAIINNTPNLSATTLLLLDFLLKS